MQHKLLLENTVAFKKVKKVWSFKVLYSTYNNLGSHA